MKLLARACYDNAANESASNASTRPCRSSSRRSNRGPRPTLHCSALPTTALQAPSDGILPQDLQPSAATRSAWRALESFDDHREDRGVAGSGRVRGRALKRRVSSAARGACQNTLRVMAEPKLWDLAEGGLPAERIRRGHSSRPSMALLASCEHAQRLLQQVVLIDGFVRRLRPERAALLGDASSAL